MTQTKVEREKNMYKDQMRGKVSQWLQDLEKREDHEEDKIKNHFNEEDDHDEIAVNINSSGFGIFTAAVNSNLQKSNPS